MRLANVVVIPGACMRNVDRGAHEGASASQMRQPYIRVSKAHANVLFNVRVYPLRIRVPVTLAFTTFALTARGF